MADDYYLDVSPYEYTPTGWLCFTVLLLLVNVEIIGWAGRYWSNRIVLYNLPLLGQIITLIIAPILFSAWCYTMLGMAIETLGQQYSYLRPKMYIIIFVACDFVSLVFQAAGGGWAATPKIPTPRTPTNIMAVGIVFQLVSMIIFSYLALDSMLRALQRRPYSGRQQEGVKMLPSTPEMGGKEYGNGAGRRALSMKS
ncbi:hypothetical protein IAR50_005192 [Cryptococcus sp. DSM 104548]